jgi:hypothetical protein
MKAICLPAFRRQFMRHPIQRLIFPLFVAISLISLPTPDARCQAVGASLNGQITDASGAAITGATVIAKNIDTGLDLTVKTSDQGVYRIAPLPPGRYELTYNRAS